MPQVPDYRPVPSVAPEHRPIPSERIDAPVAAFGGATAQALSGLGKTLEHSGDELFARAIAFQQLDNETEARNADAQYMIGAGKIHAEYNALQGQARVDAYDKYQSDLEGMRQKIRGSLSNPMSQKMFDASSLSVMGRSIFNGAGAAAEASKQSYIGAIKAKDDLDANQVEQAPKDEALFQQIRAKKVENAVNLALAEKGASGKDNPIVQDYVAKAVSSLRRSQLIGMSRTEPMDALAKYEEHSAELSESDRQAVQGILETRGSAAAAVNISNQVYSNHLKADGTLDTSVKVLQDEVRAEADRIQKENPFLKATIVEAAVAKLDSRIYRDRIAAVADKREATSELNDTIVNNNITDVQQLLVMPGIEKTLQKYGNVTTAELQKRIDGLYKMGHQQTNQTNFVRLKGLANNDVNGFLDTDLTQEPLNKVDYQTLVNIRNKLMQSPTSNPHVERAMLQLRNAIGTQLTALGIDTRRNNKDEYDKFTGTLTEAIEGFQEANHRPPSPQELVDKIAPALLKTTQTGPAWWRTTTPEYGRLQDQEIPQPIKDNIISEELAKGNVAPTDEQIKRKVLREQFKKLYGATK